jgi:hypothetical protein
MAQAGQFAVDAPVAPGRIIARHLQQQRTQGLRRARPPGMAARVRPAPPDQIGVPAQQGARGDDQAQLADMAARQQPGQRRQDRPVAPRRPRGSDMALEYGDLVAQDEDLGVFGAVGAGEQGKPAEHPEHRQINQS